LNPNPVNAVTIETLYEIRPVPSIPFTPAKMQAKSHPIPPIPPSITTHNAMPSTSPKHHLLTEIFKRELGT
jgi:hypothetical protein